MMEIFFLPLFTQAEFLSNSSNKHPDSSGKKKATERHHKRKLGQHQNCNSHPGLQKSSTEQHIFQKKQACILLGYKYHLLLMSSRLSVPPPDPFPIIPRLPHPQLQTSVHHKCRPVFTITFLEKMRAI